MGFERWVQIEVVVLFAPAIIIWVVVHLPWDHLWPWQILSFDKLLLLQRFTLLDPFECFNNFTDLRPKMVISCLGLFDQFSHLGVFDCLFGDLALSFLDNRCPCMGQVVLSLKVKRRPQKTLPYTRLILALKGGRVETSQVWEVWCAGLKFSQ